ncbi:hypothetical protein [Metarhizobium album]|uniref:hypothetical protein n=1 Tax=Metarhizobium album TaxID=2182425 RepID=UPI000FFF492E|nr:hypothetical protein [Rhizobium album]
MANEQWNFDSPLTRATLARAEAVNNLFRAISEGFDAGLSATQIMELIDEKLVEYVDERLPGRITISTEAPTGGEDGDIHFRVLP